MRFEVLFLFMRLLFTNFIFKIKYFKDQKNKIIFTLYLKKKKKKLRVISTPSKINFSLKFSQFILYYEKYI